MIIRRFEHGRFTIAQLGMARDLRTDHRDHESAQGKTHMFCDLANRLVLSLAELNLDRDTFIAVGSFNMRQLTDLSTQRLSHHEPNRVIDAHAPSLAPDREFAFHVAQ
ncbi:hypothetical protein GQ57_37530 [Burkholderia sp. MSh2]|nr:hypothetical protein GQ57_37530 [Burkholderia sp. MSh2]